MDQHGGGEWYEGVRIPESSVVVVVKVGDKDVEDGTVDPVSGSEM